MKGPTDRSLLRQGFIFLFLALAFGFGIVAGGPRARGWLAVHLTGMLTALIAVAIGLAWEKLVLSPRQRGVLYWSVVADGYWGFLAGTFATVFGVPGPVSGGGVQPEGWQATVFFSVFIPILTILPFIFSSLTIYGLREVAREPVAATSG